MRNSLISRREIILVMDLSEAVDLIYLLLIEKRMKIEEKNDFLAEKYPKKQLKLAT